MNPKETCCSYQTNRTNVKNTTFQKLKHKWEETLLLWN